MSFCGGTVSSSVSPMTLVSSTVSQTQDKIQRPEVNNNNNGNRVWSPDSTPTTWMVRPVCNGLGGRTQYKNGAIVVSGSGHSKIGLNHGGNQKNSKSPDSKIVILGNRAVGKSGRIFTSVLDIFVPVGFVILKDKTLASRKIVTI